VIINSFLLAYTIKTAKFGNNPGPHPQTHFFPTQKYFSWHTGKNLKAFVHYCKKMTENAFLLKNTQKWAKNQQ